MENEIEKVNNKEKTGRAKNGGARAGAGRKPDAELLAIKGIKDKIEKHIQEEIEVSKIDPITKSPIVKKNTRVLLILEMLFEEAYQKNNISAAKEWLDRGLGKAPQSIEHDFNAEGLIKIEAELRKLSK